MMMMMMMAMVMVIIGDAPSDRLQAGCNFNKKMISVWQIGKTFAAFAR